MNVEILLLIFFVLTSIFFSGVEIAIYGLGPLNLVRGDKKKLFKLYYSKNKVISTCLIGNNMSIVAATILVDGIASSIGKTWATSIALTFEILLFFVLAEAIPKTIFHRLDFKILQYSYWVIRFCYFLFLPLSQLFLYITDRLLRFFPAKDKLQKEDIFHFLSAHMHEQYITKGLSKLGEIQVKEVMTPVNQVKSLDRRSSVKDFVELLEKTSFSRYPIYELRGDLLIGYVESAHLLKASREEKIENYLQNPQYVSEYLPIDRMLFKMQDEKFPMAFVVSEFGSIIGLVTLENLAEELVGDIFSEEQFELPEIQKSKKDKNVYRLSGFLDIDDFNEYFNQNIKKDGFETLAGCIMKKTLNIPNKQEEIQFPFGVFKILEGDSRMIQKVLFRPNKR